jgi:putative transposase
MPGDGVLTASFLQLEAALCGFGLNELREVRQLREENQKLKWIVADLTLDKHILQEVLSKKV